MVKGCAHPMGPLALSDLIGLDTVLGVAETLYAEHREQLLRPRRSCSAWLPPASSDARQGAGSTMPERSSAAGSLATLPQSILGTAQEHAVGWLRRAIVALTPHVTTP
jgi:hypothetical protein